MDTPFDIEEAIRLREAVRLSREAVFDARTEVRLAVAEAKARGDVLLASSVVELTLSRAVNTENSALTAYREYLDRKSEGAIRRGKGRKLV
jgi:hypothetical protein